MCKEAFGRGGTTLANDDVFRVLALSGGGVRGLFQVHMLECLEREIGAPLHTIFDLCIGTSIGSVSAGAIAGGVEPKTLVSLYNEAVSRVFSTPRMIIPLRAVLRKGPLFERAALDGAVKTLFADLKFSDCKTGFVCTAGELATYNHRIFSTYDSSVTQRAMLVYNAVLASCSAPVFLAPFKAFESEEQFIDGGVWANSPALLAVQIANQQLGVPLNRIEVVSIGTCHIPKGQHSKNLSSLRPASLQTALTIYEMYAGSQVDFFDESTRSLVGSANYLSINPVLREKIELYDFKRAKAILPSLAQSEFTRVFRNSGKFFSKKSPYRLRPLVTRDPMLMEMIEVSGLKRIIPKRSYYIRYRDGSGNIESYLNSAKHSIEMVSISLSTGLGMEKVTRIFRNKLSKNLSFKVAVSLIDPDKDHLVKTVTSSISQEHFNKTPEQFASEIRTALNMLSDSRALLPEDQQDRFIIRVHDALPQGSAIILDRGHETTVIQIETKPYKAPLVDSYAIEVHPADPDGLYGTFLEAYTRLVEDGKPFERMVD